MTRGTVQAAAGVVFKLTAEMWAALKVIQAAHLRAGITRGAYVTSANDGQHGAGSKHPLGDAIDFRTRDLPPARVAELVKACTGELGNEFDVLWEYSVNGRTTYHTAFSITPAVVIAARARMAAAVNQPGEEQEHMHVERDPD